MTDKIKLIIIGVAAVVVLLIGYGLHSMIHRCPVCPKCPELVSRSHIERDSIVPHDTVFVVKYAQSIGVTALPPPSTNISQSKIVTFEVIDTMPDQAVIGFSLASVEFPDRYIPDLTHTAWYLAKPDRIRIISDTLTVQLPALKCPSRFWREVKIGGVCIGIGAIGTATYFFFK